MSARPDTTLPGSVPPFDAVRDTRCRAHAARTAVALCRSCLTPRCGECVVKVDGVNHCAACLATLFPPAGAANAARPEPASMGMSFLRFLVMAALYSSLALAAAALGVALPFFENERLLLANRSRVTEVHLALSEYYADVGEYPTADRGLAALLAPDALDREEWRGPYLSVRATDGKPPRTPADDGKVLDVFGRPVFYWNDGELVYVASPGANGDWETPGVEQGKSPRDESGDDVVQWVVWP